MLQSSSRIPGFKMQQPLATRVPAVSCRAVASATSRFGWATVAWEDPIKLSTEKVQSFLTVFAPRRMEIVEITASIKKETTAMPAAMF